MAKSKICTPYKYLILALGLYCIQSVLGYASETLAMKVEDMTRWRTERMMVRWMCGIHFKSTTASAELSRLGIECATDVVR